jgi:hypothetical protein
MIDELKFHLRQGPTTVKELVRKMGRTDSGIRKALPNIEGVVEGTNDAGHKTFSLPDDQPSAPVPSKPAAVPATPAPTRPAKRGRKASFAGKKLFPSETLLGGDDSPQTYQNPRRNGSHGYKSLQLIINHPGLTTETYLQKGGRLNDLRWDVKHGNVKAE